MNYNLLHEDWIPVLYRDGVYKRVGIRKAFQDAGHIRQIAASNPMDRVAVLRFLLALLYWCKGNPPDETSPSSGDAFPADWFSKLDTNRECFDLLGDGKRFYQYRTSKDTKQKRLTANYLVQEIPTGINMWHFRHSTDEVDGLCPACCAMGLLRLPLFATRGGRGKPPGINAKPPVYVIPVGASLAQTLRLSWQTVSGQLGEPFWESPGQALPPSGPVPLLMGFTWLPRQVWLDNREEPEAPCVSCGRRDRLIRRCVFHGIGSTKTDAEGPMRIWHDPHIIHGEKGPTDCCDVLSGSDAAAGQWADILAGMLVNPEEETHQGVPALREVVQNNPVQDPEVHAWVVGFSTVKNDKYLEGWETLIPFPCLLAQIGALSINKLEQWQKAGSKLAAKVPRSPDKKLSSKASLVNSSGVDSVRPHVEGRVFKKLGELLANGDDAWLQAAKEYRPMMGLLARSLSPGFTAEALKRRRAIASVLPDMQPKSASSKKAKRTKGGNK